jgi:hypothetical protein
MSKSKLNHLQGSRSSILPKLVLGGLCVVVGFSGAILILQTERPQGQTTQSTMCEPVAMPSDAHTRTISPPLRSRVDRSTGSAGSCPPVSVERESSYKAQRSRELMQLLRSKLASLEHANPSAPPESLIKSLHEYLEAWSDVVALSALDLTDAIADEIEKSMCNSATSPAELMLVTHVVQRLPELGNVRGFDCIFARGKEDLVTWSALEAWRVGALPKTAALTRLEQSASSPRTLRRLAKTDDEGASAEIPDSLPEAASDPAGLTPRGALAAALMHARSEGTLEQQLILEDLLDEQRQAKPGDDQRVTPIPAGPRPLQPAPTDAQHAMLSPDGAQHVVPPEAAQQAVPGGGDGRLVMQVANASDAARTNR